MTKNSLENAVTIMNNFTPLTDKVFGKMIDAYGERTTEGGLIITEDNMTDSGARARWFEITHIGPKQADVQVGQYVLVSHTRWSRGMDVDTSLREESLLFQIDTDEMLGISSVYPL